MPEQQMPSGNGIFSDFCINSSKWKPTIDELSSYAAYIYAWTQSGTMTMGDEPMTLSQWKAFHHKEK